MCVMKKNHNYISINFWVVVVAWNLKVFTWLRIRTTPSIISFFIRRFFKDTSELDLYLFTFTSSFVKMLYVCTGPFYTTFYMFMWREVAGFEHVCTFCLLIRFKLNNFLLFAKLCNDSLSPLLQSQTSIKHEECSTKLFSQTECY